MNKRLQYVLCEGLGITIDPASRLGQAVAEWLGPFVGSDGVRAALLEIRDPIRGGGTSFHAGQIQTDGDMIRAQGGSLALEFTLDGGIPAFACDIPGARTPLDLEAALRHMVSGEGSAATARALSYHGLWAILHLALLRVDHAYAHAGCVVDPTATSHLVAGAGGSGKTSTTLGLIERHGWRYQAEDFALLDAAGRTFLSPRPLTVYHSDVRWGSSLLRRFEDGLPPVEKIAWHVAAYLKRNPRRRVRFDELFQADQVVTNAARLGTVQFIRRTSVSGVLNAEDVDPVGMVEHVLAVSMRELASLYEPLLQAQGALGAETRNELRLESIFDGTRLLYRRAFASARCIRITASRDVPPERIADLVAGHA